jgi:hypothetical protein
LHKAIEAGRQCGTRNAENTMEMVEFGDSRKGQPENKETPPVSDSRQRTADRSGSAGGI